MSGLRRAWGEVRLANGLAHSELKLASSGNFSALAATSHQVGRHLARAAALARAVTPPAGLSRAHADLVRALVVGTQMADRSVPFFQHMGPGSKREYIRRVLPLEKRAVRFGNAWYTPTETRMESAGLSMPKWVDHLFDWS
jgi:hypothetical protein